MGTSGSSTLSYSLVQGGCPSGSSCPDTLLTANPMLSPLKNNGGFTQTLALGANSPAIDSANFFNCAGGQAQRGVARVIMTHEMGHMTYCMGLLLC